MQNIQFPGIGKPHWLISKKNNYSKNNCTGILSLRFSYGTWIFIRWSFCLSVNLKTDHGANRTERIFAFRYKKPQRTNESLFIRSEIKKQQKEKYLDKYTSMGLRLVIKLSEIANQNLKTKPNQKPANQTNKQLTKTNKN